MIERDPADGPLFAKSAKIKAATPNKQEHVNSITG